jgi:alkylation response protein AidB-like acyl-CoA dehydrogenase
MDLRLDALQEQLARGVRATLAHGGDAWAATAELGVLALGLPAEHGGFGLGLAAEIVAGRELGRALEPLPGYRETLLAAGALVEAGAGGALADLVMAVAAGRCRLAAAGLDAGPALELDRNGGVRGRSGLLGGIDWHGAVVRAGASGVEALLLVRLPAEGCRLETVQTVAGPMARLVFAGTRAEEVLRQGAESAVVRPRMAARVRQAAFLLGLAEHAGRIARDHAERREQFGRRLIEFQGMAHPLAAVAAELEATSLLVHEAAWRCDGGLPAEPSAAQALAAASELALRATRLAVHVHGAAGMLAGSAPARAYRLASLEAVRLGPPAELWREAGARRLAAIIRT